MKLKLINLFIQNFKGIKELKIEMDGRNINIYGDNGLGKSSIFDAWTWLLFDKDSSGKTDFEIKTLDSNGEAIHGLEHTVSARIMIENHMKVDEILKNDYPNNKEIILKKTLTEKWTKKRGEADQVFTGHETQYWIGELPISKRDYDSFISSLVPETVFRIVSHPAQFNSMKWQDRRKMLFEISGEFDEKSIFIVAQEAEEISEEIKEHGTDNLKKIIMAQKKQINKNISDIPARIDELNKSTPELNDDFEALKQDKTVFESQISGIDKNIEALELEIQNINKSMQEYQSKKYKLEDIKKKIENESLTDLKSLKSKFNSLGVQIFDKKNKLEAFKRQIEQDRKGLETVMITLRDLSSKWDVENAIKFIEPSREDFKCPTCKQNLPDGDIDTKIEDMKKSFAENKIKNIGAINNQGKSKKNEKEQLEKGIKDKEETIISLNEEVAKLYKESEMLEKEIKHKEENTQAVDYTKNEDYMKLAVEIESIKTGEFDNTKIKELQSEKEKVRGYISDIEKRLYSKTIAEKNRARIKELQDEERKLSEELCKIEKMEFLLEKYIRAKTDLISNQINSKFELAKFKLFDVQVNGGIDETCETMINGVPYTSNLNTAGKVQAGIDIIKTFSKYYDVEVPIFVDNRESVVEIPVLEAQTINLFVSEADKRIRMEAI